MDKTSARRGARLMAFDSQPAGAKPDAERYQRGLKAFWFEFAGVESALGVTAVVREEADAIVRTFLFPFEPVPPIERVLVARSRTEMARIDVGASMRVPAKLDR